MKQKCEYRNKSIGGQLKSKANVAKHSLVWKALSRCTRVYSLPTYNTPYVVLRLRQLVTF